MSPEFDGRNAVAIGVVAAEKAIAAITGLLAGGTLGQAVSDFIHQQSEGSDVPPLPDKIVGNNSRGEGKRKLTDMPAEDFEKMVDKIDGWEYKT